MLKLNTIIRGLLSQKTRSLLTSITTLCATTIITCLIAFYHSTTSQMAEEMQLIKKNTKIIVQIHPHSQRHMQVSYRDFVERIKPAFPDYAMAAAKKHYTRIHLDPLKKHSDYYEHISCDYAYLQAQNLSIQSGRFFTETDHANNHFVIIGHDVAQKVQHFNPMDTQHSLFISQKQHQVLGVVVQQQDKYFYGQNNVNRTVFTHLKTYHANALPIDEIVIHVDNPAACSQLVRDIHALFASDFPKVQFQIIDMSQTAKQLQEHITKIQFVLLAFGLICTVIAAINITNSMYAIIAERFQEIGIRLAIGATAFQVKFLLLSETLVLASASALTGVLIGEAINAYLITYLGWPYQWYAHAGPSGFMMMLLISLLSCYIPLLKVDKINPILAIQSVA